jgi:5'-deoxynucleotidase YfbR-like HD superfamily hydrolase
MHDVPEVYTGDVPAPCKWDNPAIKRGLEESEQAYITQYDIPWPELTAEEVKMVKLADMLDLVLSSLEELGRGNQYARELVKNGQNYIVGMELDDEVLIKCEQMVNEVKARWMLIDDK